MEDSPIERSRALTLGLLASKTFDFSPERTGKLYYHLSIPDLKNIIQEENSQKFL